MAATRNQDRERVSIGSEWREAAYDLVHFNAVNSVTGYDDDVGTDGGVREVERREHATERGKPVDLMPSSNNNTGGSESSMLFGVSIRMKKRMRVVDEEEEVDQKNQRRS
ncbi:hypothetical protein ACFE04_011631 [Oxalis oulophora]